MSIHPGEYSVDYDGDVGNFRKENSRLRPCDSPSNKTVRVTNLALLPYDPLLCDAIEITCDLVTLSLSNGDDDNDSEIVIGLTNDFAYIDIYNHGDELEILISIMDGETEIHYTIPYEPSTIIPIKIFFFYNGGRWFVRAMVDDDDEDHDTGIVDTTETTFPLIGNDPIKIAGYNENAVKHGVGLDNLSVSIPPV